MQSATGLDPEPVVIFENVPFPVSATANGVEVDVDALVSIFHEADPEIDTEALREDIETSATLIGAAWITDLNATDVQDVVVPTMKDYWEGNL